MGKTKGISFPYSVSKGSVTVRIYRTPSHGCDAYTVSYYQDGVRKRPTFSTFQAAKEEAEQVSLRLGSSNADVLLLKSADRASYQRAREILDPLGIGLEMAAAQVADSHRRLNGVPWSVVEDFYLKRHPAKLVQKSVKTVVEELEAAKKADGLSDRYVQALRWSLGKFAGRFHCSIAAVSGKDVDQWLRESGLAPRTRNNLRQAVHTLFRFAKARGYLPKDHDEIEAVSLVKDGDGDIEVFSPGEMSEILRCADERLIPFLTLGGFAGIRHAEIQRLDWKDIRFGEGFIEIRASKAKTASRRIVPVLDNLKRWLKPRRQDEGAVCSHQNMASAIRELVIGINKARRAAWAEATGATEEQLQQADVEARKELAEQRKLAKKNGRQTELPSPGSETAKIEGWSAFTWKHNALRHSFISYRVADVQDVAKVSLEAGNSPQMIFKHYRELVTPKEAKTWFGIKP